MGPLMLSLLAVVWAVVPRLEPLESNLKEFSREYNLLMVGLQLFVAAIFGYSLAYNLGWQIPISLVILPGLALLFSLLGWILPRTRRNWFVGIRTPWTLTSDVVWERTHAFGGRLFYAAAVVTLLGLVYPEVGVWLAVAAVLVAAAATIAYSYLEFRRLDVTD
jgi:uncharacterized membrane protein